jgi:zinc protease
MRVLPRLVPSLLLLTACSRAPVAGPETPGDPVPPPTDAPEAREKSPALPLDPAVRMGTLDNGLRFYIRHHEKPEKRAYLWLAVDAGSVLEDDDQRGLAHFVEHMAFNGTKRFEKNAIIDFLERAGMDFGADLNAYTSFDETVYQLKVPTDDPKLLTRGFDVIEDWAGALSFDPAEVEKERGVVVEEWRTGRGASQRVFDKQWPIFLKGSKYAERKPIGEKEILEKAPVETLRRFYEDWYRPDLMAVIVVGDVDPDAMEKEIRTRFSGLKKPASARERPNVPVPLLEETRVSVDQDPEMSMTQVSLAIKGPLSERKTEADFRHGLVEGLLHSMFRARFDELRRKPDSPLVFAFSSTSQMGRSVDVFNLSGGAKPGQADAALRTMMLELERVRRHGFLDSELERAKASTLRGMERSAAEADTVDGRAYTREIVRHFLQDRAMPGQAKTLELGKDLLPGITLEEINAVAKTWAARKDRVLEAAGSARDEMPSKDELLAIADAVGTQDVQPWEDTAAGATLMAAAPAPGAIAKRETLAELGVSVWTLGNGARVVLKPTDFKNDEVLLEAFSPGGHSLVKDKAFASARYAGAIMQASGIGEHDAVALGKLLAGKVANVQPWISELEEGLSGNASPKDLELLMQQVHLRFTAPRKDAAAFEAWRGQMRTFVKNRDLNPQTVFFDTLNEVGTKGHKRRLPASLAEIDAVDLEAAHAFYGERFADAGDFTFVLVGSFDESEVEGLVTKYLASLPSKSRKEKWRDVKVRHPRGVESFRVQKGQDPKSMVLLDFHGTTKWTSDAEDDLDVLADVLDIRLREVLREDMSGVYGVSSRGNIARRPTQRYSYTVRFGCSPDNAGALKKAVFDVIAGVKKEGIAQDYLDKIKEQRRRQIEQNKKENRFWLRQLAEHYRYGTDPSEILQLEAKLERITADNVQKAAKTYLDTNRYLDGLLVPETAATSGSAAAPAANPG